MKKILYLITIVIVLQCCKNDETPTPLNGSVSFSFNASTSKTGRANEAATPAFALISIEDSKGTPIESSKKIALIAFGNGYVSEQLQLKQGDYKLTLFIITDSNGKAIYASPLTGSALADKVEHPLPLTFTVGQAQATIIPEVIAVEDDVTPDAFGYVNFGFEIVQANLIELLLTDFGIPIQRITLEFKNDTKHINADVVSVNNKLTFNDSELYGEKWESEIELWLQTDDCYQEVLRFKGEIDLTSANVINLPLATDPSWKKYFYSEYVNGQNKISIYRSQNYNDLSVELNYTPGLVIYYGYADLGVWDINMNVLCNMTISMIDGKKGSPFITTVPYACPNPTAPIAYIDDMIILDVTDFGYIEDYFKWTVDNVPYCENPAASVNGRERSTNRKGKIAMHQKDFTPARSK